MSSPRNPIIERLITTEAKVHYKQPPPPKEQPFVIVARNSSILISAPHGSRAFRNNSKEIWHEEDEYTAGMALLLGEVCDTSVIANVWQSDKCDPNWHDVKECLYKQEMQNLTRHQPIRWVLDLHGAAETSLRSQTNLVDLGTRKDCKSMEDRHRDKLREFIEARLGVGCVSSNIFQGGEVTVFCRDILRVQAVQIEMKPSVRVPLRKSEASSFKTLGSFSAAPEKVIAMLTALEDFITYLKELPKS